MSILDIRTIPDPVLKKISAPVQEITPEAIQLISDLSDTLRHHQRCVGIAAPQVGKNLRIVIVDVSLHPRPHSNHGTLILINPAINHTEGKLLGREGCLSVPELTGNVARAEKILVRFTDENGKDRSVEAEGFEAVVLQHEIDHLDGILFLDRVSSLKTDIFRRKTY